MTQKEAPTGAPSGSANAGSKGSWEDKGPSACGLNLDSPVGAVTVRLKGLQVVKPETIAPELADFQSEADAREERNST